MNKIKEYIKKLVLRAKNNDCKGLIKRTTKDTIFWVRLSAYAIPLAFLLYVLYINFLPFGFKETFVIKVGSPGDTFGQFYLEPTPNLSSPKTTTDGNTYRELNGFAFAVFKPNAILKNADISVSVEGEGASLIPRIINIDPSTIKWDNSWDFTTSIPHDLKGNAFIFDGETTFNGRNTQLELPDSANMFENGPFTLYTEWDPKDSQDDNQQIVGHYNWELWQNKNSILFQVGRMNDVNGPFYSVNYPIGVDFFNVKHTALAIYNPGVNGYIDLYVDNNLAGRTYFNSDIIWRDYNGKINLSFGKAEHGIANYFNGTLNKVCLVSKNIIASQTNINFKYTNNGPLNIVVLSNATSSIKQLKLNVTQK